MEGRLRYAKQGRIILHEQMTILLGFLLLNQAQGLRSFSAFTVSLSKFLLNNFWLFNDAFYYASFI